jgi:o-succinylbenzoate synthase
VRLIEAELRRLRLPLVRPFRTSFGTEADRDILLVRVTTDAGVSGWGECVAGTAPLYSSEYVDGAHHVLRTFLLDAVAAVPALTADRVAPALAPVKGHPMAKAALEMAVLDAETKSRGISFAEQLGAVRERVPVGVSVGIADSLPELLDEVDAYVEQGYQRIKLKIQPGWDVAPVDAVRSRLPGTLLQVDANTAYTLGDARHLAQLDSFDLLMIEQPLPEDDVRGHAELARRVETPICLDESIVSARAAADAIALGACSIVNIKPGRVGGYLEARRVHDVCAASGVPVWCGGMLETGLGRAANLALAGLPNFTLPGDISGSDRYWSRDLLEVPLLLDNGAMRVPNGPGLGVDVDVAWLDELTVSVENIDLR